MCSELLPFPGKQLAKVYKKWRAKTVIFEAKIGPLSQNSATIKDWRQCDQKKVAKCLKKVAKNDFTRKMTDFDKYTKIA